ncbi:MAG: aminotransferase class I/II-fold pyridoxal phosphate-dependent enzyme [Proteobacteria bacterium]|nr:aminotransferase class I/II-fold pyridoxal phosphate-dependent enzyme [Pseudomonadota bacterium]
MSAPVHAPIARRLAGIAPFHVMEVQTAARALEAAGRDVVHMEIGEPDFPTPDPVCEAAARVLAEKGIYYTSALGIPALRERIAEHYRMHLGADVAADQVIVTAGSSAALLLVLALILDDGSDVLLADPNYPCNRHFVHTLGGRPVGIPVGPGTRYQLDAALVAQHWTRDTRAVLIASPSNPTGTEVAHDELARIAAETTRRNAHLVVDEIYLGLSYRGAPRSSVGLAEDQFVISSFSKYFNMTGWRLGWVVAPRRHVRDLEKLAQNLYISPPTLSQRAALACFEPRTLAILEDRRIAFRDRRDYLVAALRELGFGIPVVPTGGFFLYADCSRWSDDSRAFCRDALAATGVAFTPGIDFGTHRANVHVRFAYTIEHARLQDGVARLGAWLATLPVRPAHA